MSKAIHPADKSGGLLAPLDKYFWSFVNYTPIKNRFKKLSDIPSSTPLSDKISKDLKKRGFSFVGTTICYALMQAVGIVNDHVEGCFRYN